jgi:predicted nucleic acid-binding protein
MSRCYIDTNFLYVHLHAGDPETLAWAGGWRGRLEQELADDAGVISGLVIDELAYRSVLTWLREDGDANPLSTFRSRPRAVMATTRSRLRRIWEAIEELDLEVALTDRGVVRRATELMSDPGLPPRDAFHAAHALDSQCAVIVSADPDYDVLADLRRLGPAEPAPLLNPAP